jgi:hypothetical protein
LPIVGYFALHYATSLSLTVILSIFLSIMGAVSFLAFLIRAWALWRTKSDCHPARSGESLGFRLLLLEICLHVLRAHRADHERHHDREPPNRLITAIYLDTLGLGANGHCRSDAGFAYQSPLSNVSLQRGDPLRPGVYIIVEDVVAVDGKQGSAWRQAWNDRYLFSPVFRKVLSHIERTWAATGLSVVAIVWGVVFGVDNREIGYALGERISYPCIFMAFTNTARAGLYHLPGEQLSRSSQ